VGVAVPGDEELESELVDAVVMLGFDAVSFGLPVLRQQEERRCVRGLCGEQEVEQDEGVRVPPVQVRHEVHRDPDDHHGALDTDEGP
jgi:hypothetical protein